MIHFNLQLLYVVLFFINMFQFAILFFCYFIFYFVVSTQDILFVDGKNGILIILNQVRH